MKTNHTRGETYTMKKRTIIRSANVCAAMTTQEFLNWHENTDFKAYESTFEQVYDILDKYDATGNTDVDKVYETLSEKDREQITAIINASHVKGSELLREIESSVYKSEVRSTEVTLTSVSTGKSITIDIMRIPDSVVDQIADF